MCIFKLLPFLLFVSFLTAREQELLKTTDINKVMKQILEHHVTQKEMTGKVLRNALAIYINQFDPNRIYLLEGEIKPFLALSDQEYQQVLEQYKNQNYAIFLRMNKIIQDSIERSRRLRRGIEEDARETLFQVKSKKDSSIMAPNPSFAQSINELKERIYKNLELFIDVQRQRFSDSIVAKQKEETIRAYEHHLREFENQYLYLNDLGEPLPSIEQENLFAIHVLKALASSLDSHTSFYQTNEAYDLRVLLRKEFPGVGIVFKDTQDGIQVTSLLPGGPGDKSGQIQVGDILLEIDGKPITYQPFEKTMESLHESTNPRVTLVFLRKGANGEEKISVNLVKEMIVLKNDRVDTSYENFGNGIIGKIALHSFYQGDGITSEKDVRDAIEQLKVKGPIKGLILDLRDNSGGFLSQAVKVAGLFITNGVIVISKYSDGDERIYRDVDSKVSYDGPLVVLTSKTTASAAEIVAQALQDYGVALVVGDERTYGKGTIQTQTVTDNQSSSYFKVTVGKYYTVSGKTPQKEGVKADIVVPSHWNKEKIGEEYLDSVSGDKIESFYNDQLKDVSADVKAWYMKYYVPKIQPKKTIWVDLLPNLKKNSEYRIAHNKNYQYYLKGDGADKEDELSEEEEILGITDKKQKDYGEDDLQIQEAVNIVKDMVLMQTVKK